MPKRVTTRLVRFSKWVIYYLKEERRKVRQLRTENVRLYSEGNRKQGRIDYLEAVLASTEMLVRTLSEEAERHPVTSLYNRRGLERKFLEYAQILGRALNKPAEMTAVFMDLDGFKQMNDRYGHDAGDQVLCSVSEIINVVFSRLTDIKGHIGGDEFVAILPHTDPEAARVLSTQIYIRLQESSESHIQDFLKAGCGISIGIASIATSHKEDVLPALNEALKAADAAMYASKNNGKGCISLAA